MLRNTVLPTILMAGIIAVTASCNHDSYETGDGDLSYLHADYADLTIANAKVTDIITDDDVHLIPPSDLAVSSQIPPDTMLRRIIHYNMTDVSVPITLLNFTDVSIVRPHDKAEIAEMKTDPVKLTAAWLSRNRCYLNLHLGLMTGSSNGISNQQLIQFVTDSIHTGGKGAIFLSLYHDQAGIAEYYTQDTHVSLPLNDLVHTATQPDTISVTVNTYSGTVTKVFVK